MSAAGTPVGSGGIFPSPARSCNHCKAEAGAAIPFHDREARLERIEELSHTGDVGFRLTADAPPGLFRLAAEGLRRALGHEAAPTVLEEETVRLQRPDAERLLVSWLRTLLEGGERREAVPAPAAIDVTLAEDLPATLEARVAWHRRSAGPVREVKGVTYHGLEVRKRPGHWEATIVLDL